MTNFESRADQLQVEANKADSGQRKAEQKRLHEIRSGVHDDAEETAEAEFAAGGADSEPEEQIKLEGVEAELSNLSKRFLSVDEIDAALRKLKGVKVEIPEDEKERLKGLLPKELPSQILSKIYKLKSVIEGDKAPLIMQLPQRVVIDGQGRSFTIATMYEIMQKAHKAGSLQKPLWITDHVTDETRSKEWSSELGVWTSACLKDSKDKKYRAQLKHQKSVLGEGHEIQADMILAMALRYIQGDDELMRPDFMRLNDKDTDGDPLDVYSYDIALCLGTSYGNARSDRGLGASFRISS